MKKVLLSERKTTDKQQQMFHVNGKYGFVVCMERFFVILWPDKVEEALRWDKSSVEIQRKCRMIIC